jgi:hypothetical protein
MTKADQSALIYPANQYPTGAAWLDLFPGNSRIVRQTNSSVRALRADTKSALSCTTTPTIRRGQHTLHRPSQQRRYPGRHFDLGEGQDKRLACPLYIIVVDHGTAGSFMINNETVTPPGIHDSNGLQAGFPIKIASGMTICESVFLGSANGGFQ